jgi:dienelactone hydrolase
VPLDVEEELREDEPDHTRLLLRYRVDPETWTEAYVLIPKGFFGRRPGAVVLHQTSETHMRDSIGLSGRETMHIALQLVRRGYVCIAPRCFLWERPGMGYQQVTEHVLKRWHTGMARMTWDAIRATDVLAARSEVDPHRLASLGHSLGGKEVLYHAALDPRIRAAVSCEGGVGRGFSNWDADWYLGKQIKAPGFDFDHQMLLALIAPRAFLLIGGESADGAQSWPYVEAALPAWRLFGKEERVGLFRHTYGHDLPPPGPDRERVYGWLDHWLGVRQEARAVQ